MGFLKRLFGGAPASPEVTITLEGAGDDDQLAEVTVGAITIPAGIYRDHQRDTQDWSSGVRLEDPRTGRMLTRDDDYPEEFRTAGARVFPVVGLPYHPDSQGDAFGVGQMVRLVPEPTNPANPRAVAVRSADGRKLAGYIPNDELPRLAATVPQPDVGLVVWENYTWRPRNRLGLRVLVGPSVRLRLLSPREEQGERERRERIYTAGREQERIDAEAYWAERERQKAVEAAAKEARRKDREADRAARAQREALEGQRRAAGLCIECGGTIVREPGQRGRMPVRCSSCRATEAATAPATPIRDPAPASTARRGPAADLPAAQQFLVIQGLLADGIITQAEYDVKRAEIVAKL